MKKDIKEKDMLRKFLEVFWLRPENALWCAYQDSAYQKGPHKLTSPSLDFGAGNGLLSFVSMGGVISPEYDFFTNAGSLDAFHQGVDIYDSFSNPGKPEYIIKKPDQVIDFALDHKENLLKQAEFLGVYEKLITADGNKAWPIESESLGSVISNVLYWLSDKHHSFRELHRILKKDGKAFLFLQTKNFTKFCISYHPENYPGYEQTLRKLNRNRIESHLWQTDLKELQEMATQYNFKLVHHQYCYSKLFLTMWDIGLRPLSPVLIDMANSFSAEERKKYKEKWVDILYEILKPVYDQETEKDLKEGGYIFVVLQKK
ncbi:MAG: methyltransferase domain-containing protein [Parcubacteria group bacterium]|nr:methyltransferase domain-containing protein [Parcubacteria group bacterium]